MSTCPTCGEQSEDQFDSCWKCGSALRDADGRVIPRSTAPPVPTPEVVRHRMFRGTFTTWKALFEEAGEFATRVGRERLIGICHSEDQSNSVVVVWYWGPPREDGVQ